MGIESKWRKLHNRLVVEWEKVINIWVKNYWLLDLIQLFYQRNAMNSFQIIITWISLGWIVEWWWIVFVVWLTKAFSLISSQDHFQRFTPSWISVMLQTGFEPVRNLSLDFVKWSCAVVINIILMIILMILFVTICLFCFRYKTNAIDHLVIG